MMNTKKITNVLFSGILVIGLLISCEDLNRGFDDFPLTDTELIEAIENATDKIEIEPGELPDSAIITLEGDYSENYTEKAFLAPDYGYKVQIRAEKGVYVGEPSKVYFNTEGRELSRGEQGDYHSGKRGKDCFEFVFPISIKMPNDSIIEVENVDDWKKVKDWYMANNLIHQKPEFIFPVAITFDNDSTVQVNDSTQLKAVHHQCHENRPEKCFEFVFPATFTMPDGTEVTFNNAEEMDKKMKEFHDSNPGNNKPPAPHFPVDIILQGGTTKTINNHEELKAIDEQCKQGL